MSNIPKVPKLPKTKSVSSQDHTSPEHEALLNKMWKNLDGIVSSLYEIDTKKLMSLHKDAVNSYIESYERRLSDLEACSPDSPAQKKLVTDTIRKIKGYIDKFEIPFLDVHQSAIEVTEKKYQKELLNEKDIVVGYVDIYIEFEKLERLSLSQELNGVYKSYFGSNPDVDAKDRYIKSLCEIDYKVPEWFMHKTTLLVNIDIRATAPTLAQLTRELQVIKNYMRGPNLLVVFDHIENPLTKEVLRGHDIACINLSDFDL